MTEGQGGLPAAGWFDDGTGTGTTRWWNGSYWTEHVQQAAPSTAGSPESDVSRLHPVAEAQASAAQSGEQPSARPDSDPAPQDPAQAQPNQVQAQPNAAQVQSDPTLTPTDSPTDGRPNPTSVRSNPADGHPHAAQAQQNAVPAQPSAASGRSEPADGQPHPTQAEQSPVHAQSNAFSGQPDPGSGQPSPLFGQPNSADEQQNPVHGQPSPAYGQPDPMYGHPSPMFDQPNPAYGQPNPAYGQSNPAYGPSNPAYGQPQQQPNVPPQPSYLPYQPIYQQVTPPPVGFRDAIRDFFKGYVRFTGTTSRQPFWYGVLFVGVIAIALFLLGTLLSFLVSFGISGLSSDGTLDGGAIALVIVSALLSNLGTVWLLATALPLLANAARRLRDGAYSPFLLFILLVPGGSVVLLVLYCLPSRRAFTYGGVATQA